MTRRKRIIWVLGTVICALVLGVVGYVVSGSTAVESWVGSQLLEMGGTYLAPELRFERLTYVRPRTIVLDKLTLSSPDPAHPGHSLVILAVKRARLELTEMPRRGRPIRFSRVILESPEMHAIAATPGGGGGGGLVGYSHFIRTAADSAAPGVTAAAPAPLKLSDFLLMRQVEIIDGTVSYDPRMPDMLPLWLDGINARLDFTPSGTSANPGLYTIATTISRKPALDLSLNGHVDIDTLTMELAKLELTLDLQEKNAHFLPPELQKILQTFEVTGQLHVTVAGTLPLADWRQTTLQSRGELTAAQVAAGQTRLAIGAWNWDLEVAAGVATIRKADAQLLGGELHISGSIPLDGAAPARLRLNANDIQIQQLLRSNKPGELPLYAGNLSAAITYSAPLALWNKQAAGGGTLSIRQGRVDNIPLLGRIVAGVSQSLAGALGKHAPDLTDTADGTFSFAGEGVHFDHFSGTSGSLGLRGSGSVGFDGRLDLRLNGGPMEGLQNSLGAIGEAWASASDALAGYRVTGTVDDPKVTMELGRAP